MDVEAAYLALSLREGVAASDAERSNLRRARRALAGLAEYAEHSGPAAADSLADLVQDMLADLMHLALAADLDFDHRLAVAGQHYIEECELGWSHV